MSNTQILASAGDIEKILSPATIRSRCAAIYGMACEGGTNFKIDLKKFERAVGLVVEVTRDNYPDLNIPFHARWRHFQCGGINRIGILDKALESLSREDRARAKIDLAVISVLLDAGAGAEWKFSENAGAFVVGRSEGLAVASFYMFLGGKFSSAGKEPFRADAQGLKSLAKATLEAGFQIGAGNRMNGLEGRFQLLRDLGGALESNPKFFGEEKARPGNLFDYLRGKASSGKLPAVAILRAVQEGFGSIWPNRISINGFNLGDTWLYPPLGSGVEALVPFHKLSQWLSYSLIEPIVEAGLEVVDIDVLTGLAEYRNGGLMLDSDLIRLRNTKLREKEHEPGSALVVEWRALTVHLLDLMGDAVRYQLGKTKAEFPLAKVLEGGTWWAGRKLAAQRASDGSPPLKICSDGTVF